MLLNLKNGREINLSAETNPLFLNKLREKLSSHADLNNPEVTRYFEKDRKRRTRELSLKLVELRMSNRNSSLDKKGRLNLVLRKNSKRGLVKSLKHQSQLINQINKCKLISRPQNQT